MSSKERRTNNMSMPSLVLGLICGTLLGFVLGVWFVIEVVERRD